MYFFYLCGCMDYRSQLLPVKGIMNARDLGGYEVEGGMRIRKGMLFRSAHMSDATDADIEYLSTLPIEKVVDFRMDREKGGMPDKRIRGAEYLSVPIDASGTVAAQATDEEKKVFNQKKHFSINKMIVIAAFNDKVKAVARDLYPTIVMYPVCQRQMAAFMHLLVDEGNVPLLFHCTQGKDRTGVASALILAALGASRETIIADFDATNEVYAQDVKDCIRKVRFCGGAEPEFEVVKALIGANTGNFIRTLDAIDAEYGSLQGYLAGPMGLTQDDIRILKERYLEKDI